MVCIHILQFSAIYNHATQLSFDDYGNEHHYQLLRCHVNHLLRRQTNHLKGKILNYYEIYDTAGYRKNLEFIWSPLFYHVLIHGMNKRACSEPCHTSKIEMLPS